MSQMSRKERTPERKGMLLAIDHLEEAIDHFVGSGDHDISVMSPNDYEVEGPPIREMQGRLARIRADLSTLYRRLDS
jgi:hypothetical protein